MIIFENLSSTWFDSNVPWKVIILKSILLVWLKPFVSIQTWYKLIAAFTTYFKGRDFMKKKKKLTTCLYKYCPLSCIENEAACNS